MLVWIFMNIFFIDTSAPSIKILSLFVGRDLFWRSNGFATAYKRSYRNNVCHVEIVIIFFLRIRVDHHLTKSFDKENFEYKCKNALKLGVLRGKKKNEDNFE